HSARRHRDRCRRSSRSIAEALVVHEEEQLVLENGTAERGAELVLVEVGLRDVIVIVVGPGVGLPILVLIKIVNAAVELVGSGLGDSDDFAAVYVAVFGVSVTGDDA